MPMFLGSPNISLAHECQSIDEHMDASSTHTDTDIRSAIERRRLGFADLPRELRDDILRLTLAGMDLNTDLTDRPCATYRALAQVSRLVRVESADIYWSCPQRSFLYSTPFSTCRPKQISVCRMLPEPVIKFESSHATWWSVNDFDKLEAWYDAYGKLALHRIRHLSIWIRPCARRLNLDLARHQVQMKLQHPDQAWGCEEKMEAFALSVLLPDGQITMTFERLMTLCSALAGVGLAKFGFMDLTPKKHNDAAITELLSIER